MPTIIEGRFGLGFSQSPYLFNNFGFKVEIANGNRFEKVTAKSKYGWFFKELKCQYIKICTKFRLNNELVDLSDCGYHTFLSSKDTKFSICNVEKLT